MRSWLRHSGLRAAIALLFGVFAVGAARAAEPSWRPSMPIKIIVPFAAGGPSDTVARIISDEMSTYLGQPIYIENISGEGGRTGVLHFLQEARDGHTLLLGHMGTHGAAPALNSELGYDPLADFAPVGLAAGTPVVICTSRKLGVRDIQSLKSFLTMTGRDLQVAHAGRGSVSHSGALLLSSVLGTQPALSSYNGTGPALNDLLTGHIDIMVDQIVNVAPAIMSGDIVPIAIASRTRSPLLGGVPSVSEIGMEGMRMDAWNALFATAGTPPDQIETLNQALRDTLSRSSTRARLLDLGAEVPDAEDATPEALRHLVENETRRWSETLFELRGSQALR